MKGSLKWLLMVGLILGVQLGCSEDDTGGGGGGDDDTGTDQGGNDTSDTGTGQAQGGDLLLDDFEDGDLISLVGAEFTSFDDNSETEGGPGASTVTLENAAEGYNSNGSLSLTYALDQGQFSWDPFVGWTLGVATDNGATPFDISPYAGVSYWHKGAAHSVRIEINAVQDFAFHQVSVPESADWVLVELPVENFAQPTDWGDAVDFNPADVNNLSVQVQGSTGDTGTVQMDDITFYTAK
jgi:endoglucanase